MSQVQAIKDATDIIEIIGERISLQRSGANWRALCPFHSEKSPSFFVSEQMQRYRCFGCGESGDVFTFLEKYEGMTFGEALRSLADRAGITLEERVLTDQDQQRQRLLGLLDLAKEYYHYLLVKHQTGQIARDYLKERGVSAESIKLFQLGYSLPGWDGLLKYLVAKKGYKESELEQVGLIIKGKHGRYYDRFRGRVIFPLTNHRGQVVGFSGRTLDPDAKTAKYINSPETSLYHKSELLFGLSELYQEIRKSRSVIVTEGEFDVISSAQAHVNNIVAIKGSALTKQHAERLRRSVDKIILALDNDSAGVEATKRAIELVTAAGLELRVAQLPGSKDVDELARTQPKLWRETAQSAVSVYEFFLQAALRQHSASSPEGKRAIMTELAPIFNQIPLAVEQDVYVKKLAKALKVREETVRTDLAKLARSRAIAQPKRDAEASPRPAESAQDKLESYALFLLLSQPSSQWPKLATELEKVSWHLPGAATIIDKIRRQSVKNIEELAKQLDNDVQDVLLAVMAKPAFTQAVENSDLAQEWRQTKTKLRQETTKQRIAAITAELEQLDAKGDDKTTADEQRQEALLAEIVQLRSQQKVTT